MKSEILNLYIVTFFDKKIKPPALKTNKLTVKLKK